MGYSFLNKSHSSNFTNADKFEKLVIPSVTLPSKVTKNDIFDACYLLKNHDDVCNATMGYVMTNDVTADRLKKAISNLDVEAVRIAVDRKRAVYSSDLEPNEKKTFCKALYDQVLAKIKPVNDQSALSDQSSFTAFYEKAFEIQKILNCSYIFDPVLTNYQECMMWHEYNVVHNFFRKNATHASFLNVILGNSYERYCEIFRAADSPATKKAYAEYMVALFSKVDATKMEAKLINVFLVLYPKLKEAYAKEDTELFVETFETLKEDLILDYGPQRAFPDELFFNLLFHQETDSKFICCVLKAFSPFGFDVKAIKESPKTAAQSVLDSFDFMFVNDASKVFKNFPSSLYAGFKNKLASLLV
jgi:hypothetical protein